MTCHIAIPDSNVIPVIRKVASIRVRKSFKEKVSTAEIVLPKNVNIINRVGPKELFKLGAAINISYGYRGNNIKRFTGYITSVSSDYPVVIKCQDEMWKVKRIPVNYSKENVTLDKLLKDLCPGYEIDALEGASLGTVRFAKSTVGEVLDKLKSEFNLYTYMDGKTIVCGKYYSRSTTIHEVVLDRHTAENNLEFKSAEDVLIMVKGTGISTKGVRVNYSKGEEGGDSIDMTWFGVEQKSELQKIVDEAYVIRKRGGLTGTITVNGYEDVSPGEKVKFKSHLKPYQEGVYYVDANNESFSTAGIKQELTLGGQAL